MKTGRETQILKTSPLRSRTRRRTFILEGDDLEREATIEVEEDLEREAPELEGNFFRLLGEANLLGEAHQNYCRPICFREYNKGVGLEEKTNKPLNIFLAGRGWWNTKEEKHPRAYFRECRRSTIFTTSQQ